MRRKTLLHLKPLLVTFAMLFLVASVLLPASWTSVSANPRVVAKPPEFNDIVKLVERHFGVKHRGFSFAERAAIKVGRKVAGFAVSDARRYLELGSIKFVIFEGQDFSRPATNSSFSAMMNAALAPDWHPLVEMRSDRDADQTYVFLRDEGKRFKILVVNFSGSDGVVVQANLRMDKLSELLRQPEEAVRSISDEARTENAPE